MPPSRLSLRALGLALSLALVGLFVSAPASAKAKVQPLVEAPAAVDSLRTEVLKSTGEALLGEDAPWIAGWTLGGEVWNIDQAVADSAYDRVAIVFFATWCAPCRNGIAKLTERAVELTRNRVRVVLVNFGEDAAKVSGYIGAGAPFLVVLDRYGNTKKMYLRSIGESVALPQTVVVGRNKRIQLIIGKEGPDYVDRIIAGR